MRSQPLVVSLVLLSSFAVAQTKAPAAQKPAAKTQAQTPAKPSTAPAKPAQSTAKPSEVPETEPVVTVNGVCERKAAPPDDCKTIITRAQFERILAAAAPARAGNLAQLPPGVKRSLATQYVQLLTISSDAEKQGVQNTPEAQELLKLNRMQALAQAYSRVLQKKYEPTEAEIKAFYDANAAKLEQATVQRLVIPKASPTETKPADAKAPDDADKANAEKFRARAVAGESFDTLQKEALAGTSNKTAPDTKMVVQKGTLPPDQESVFNLKPGEVSQVLTEPGGFFIYRMESKGTVPFEQVKSEIQQRLLQEKLQAAMESMLKQATPVLNEKYFGPAQPATQVLPGANPSPQNGVSPAPAAKPSSTEPEKPKTEPQPK